MNAELIAQPTNHFDDAAQVLSSERLSHEEKITLLRNWANELRQLMAAEEENMSAQKNCADQLASVEKALLKLGEESGPHDAKA